MAVASCVEMKFQCLGSWGAGIVLLWLAEFVVRDQYKEEGVSLVGSRETHILTTAERCGLCSLLFSMALLLPALR